MNYVIGIDGGATKTTVAAADMDGTVLSTGSSGPANLHSVEKPDIKKHVFEALKQAGKNLPKSAVPVAVCFGASGLDAPRDKDYALELLGEWFPQVKKTHRTAVNDVVIARRSNSEKPYGLAVISGTGSNAYGVNKYGEEAFAGGLGWLLADEGSGFAAGRAALRAAVRSEDGREASVLEKLVKEKLKVSSMREVVGRLYDKPLDKAFIASFAPVVDAGEERGDEIAKRILETAADGLFKHVRALASRLNMQDEKADVVLIGSMMNKSPYLRERFDAAVLKAFPAFTLVPAKNDPVVGAVRVALGLLIK